MVTARLGMASPEPVPEPSDKCEAGTQERAVASLSTLAGVMPLSKGIRSIVGLFIASQARVVTTANKQ